MPLLKDIGELNAKQFVIAVGFFLATIGPGVLCLFLFKRDLFSDLDSVKVILLSVALTLPLANFNLFLIAAPLSKTKKEANLNFPWLCFNAFLLTSGIMYASIYVAFIYGFTFKTFTFITTGAELIAAIVCLKKAHDLHAKNKTTI